MNQFLKLEKLKTLLVDDNAVVRDNMKMIFTQKGCLLKAFETAEEGLQALEEEQFDILISDFQLPGIDGVEFFKRAAHLQPDTIRILISGYGNENVVSEAFEIGVHAFVRKPFSLTAFFDQLMPHVDRRYHRTSGDDDSKESEEDPESQNQSRASGNQSKGSWRTKAKHKMRPLSYLPPNTRKKGTLSSRGFCPNQAAV